MEFEETNRMEALQLVASRPSCWLVFGFIFNVDLFINFGILCGITMFCFFCFWCVRFIV